MRRALEWPVLRVDVKNRKDSVRFSQFVPDAPRSWRVRESRGLGLSLKLEIRVFVEPSNYHLRNRALRVSKAACIGGRDRLAVAADVAKP